ncbi:NUDIX hydrolase [Ureibacillus chungkukjangi]|uniref:NUDIX hydrolase n=1 Tax=Ureibacillus chungkukjangi TaxID=1202712 RepID=UPI0020401DB7|nr:NUDIX hydrolase [Ureibacillus chungkukjangi]MCM3389891.1 NUDIX hydrolase [Ureibacillus chungkukjangi]
MHRLKNNGFEFLEFIHIAEKEIFNYHPIAGSFAIVEHNGRYLMGYNIWRKQWELPAGSREEQETPKECAIRELYEETGQAIPDMEFKGLLKSRNTVSGEVKYNPVYFRKVNEIQPFKHNEEISEIRLWDLKEDIGIIDSVDIKILNFV